MSRGEPVPKVTLTEQVPAPTRSRDSWGLTGLVVLLDFALLLVGFAGWAGVFALLALALLVLEVLLVRRAPFQTWAFGRLQAGAPFRGLVQGLALLVLLVRTDQVSWVWLAALGLLVVHVLRVLGSALAEWSFRQRKLPILVRGLAGVPAPPAAPPSLLASHATEVLSWPLGLVTFSGALAAALSTVWVLVGGVCAAVVLVLAGVGVLARKVLAGRRLSRSAYLSAVSAALSSLAAPVVLYHAGGPSTLYQLRMWLETAESLDVPVLVVLRDRSSFASLGPTSLPVVCVEHSTVMMGLDLPGLRLALYPAHSTGNLHLLRRAGVVHAFIGHGDSDKSVTVNPFLKAYDEIWVAGPAARDRFAAAGLELRSIVEVGRPDAPAPSTPSAARLHEFREPLTVLYTPTWEGYEDDPQQTSVGPLGLELVGELARTEGVRVLYRPHPLAGSRDAGVRRDHRRILELLGITGTAARFVPESRETADSRGEYVAAQRDWTREQLARPGHLETPGPDFDLQACFEIADVLLTDVSSVITDFLATGKPYGVADPKGLSSAEFGVRYPASRGGFLLGRASDIAGLLDAGRAPGDPGTDPNEHERTRLRDRLLGPAAPSAGERFRNAVHNVVQRE